jgi:hypothetical protein
LSGKPTPDLWKSLYGDSGKPATNKGGYSLWGKLTVIPANQFLQSFNILYMLAEARLNSAFYIA